MTVLGGVCHQLAGHDAAGAAAVLHDELLAEPRGQLRGEQAPDGVVDRAWRERNDDAYRLGWVILRGRAGAEHYKDRCKFKNACKDAQHRTLPPVLPYFAIFLSGDELPFQRAYHSQRPASARQIVEFMLGGLLARCERSDACRLCGRARKLIRGVRNALASER